MATDDRSGIPHELRGFVGQVTSGAPIAPALAPSPGPGALAGSSPGITSGVVTPIASPTLPDPSDPTAMTLLLSRMAGELFAGWSLSPAPETPPQGGTPPGSPAIAPAMAPAIPPAPDRSAQPPGPPVPPGLGPISTGTAPAASAPPTSGPVPRAPTTPHGGLGSSYSAPATATGVEGASHPGPPEVPSADAAANPFAGAPALDALLGGFEASVLETMHLPVIDHAAPDLAPYFIPASDALTLDTEVGSPRIEATDPAHDALIRSIHSGGGAAFDPYAVRRDFPILDERIHGKRLVWLDNAATTQKPRAVIDRLSHYYEHENSNVHRGAHTLAARATDAYESGRDATRRFLNASSVNEIVFVRGATEGINLIAQSWGRRHVEAGDEIVITHLEHHANIVPWQQLCAEKGARLRVAPVDDRGDVILEQYERLLNPRTRLVAFPQVSNALGTITPAREMVELAHRHGARVLVDGAQAVSHMRVDVQQLDCDWYVFSGHKVFAPTGIGAVFGKRDVLEQMPPWQGGGNMIQDVTFEKTVYQPPPWRFEAGTGSIGDAAGLGAALDYVMRIGIDVIDRYEHDLLAYGTERLRTVPGLTMIGTSPNKAGVLSFVLDGQRTEDVGAALDKDGIAVRSGHHCAQPIHRRFGLEGSVRASLAFYNVCDDIDDLVDALHRLQAGRG